MNLENPYGICILKIRLEYPPHESVPLHIPNLEQEDLEKYVRRWRILIRVHG